MLDLNVLKFPVGASWADPFLSVAIYDLLVTHLLINFVSRNQEAPFGCWNFFSNHLAVDMCNLSSTLNM